MLRRFWRRRSPGCLLPPAGRHALPIACRPRAVDRSVQRRRHKHHKVCPRQSSRELLPADGSSSTTTSLCVLPSSRDMPYLLLMPSDWTTTRTGGVSGAHRWWSGGTSSVRLSGTSGDWRRQRGLCLATRNFCGSFHPVKLRSIARYKYLARVLSIRGSLVFSNAYKWGKKKEINKRRQMAWQSRSQCHEWQFYEANLENGNFEKPDIESSKYVIFSSVLATWWYDPFLVDFLHAVMTCFTQFYVEWSSV